MAVKRPLFWTDAVSHLHHEIKLGNIGSFLYVRVRLGLNLTSQPSTILVLLVYRQNLEFSDKELAIGLSFLKRYQTFGSIFKSFEVFNSSFL